MNIFQEREKNWEDVCFEEGIAYRVKQSGSAIVALCVFHEEKNPSMWMYTGGELNCYGCGANVTLDDFKEKFNKQLIENDLSLLRQALKEAQAPSTT